MFWFLNLCWGKVPSVNTCGYHYHRRRNTLFKQAVYTEHWMWHLQEQTCCSTTGLLSGQLAWSLYLTAFHFCNRAKITRQFISNCIFLLPFPITKAASCRCYHQKLPVKREWLEWVKIWLGKKNLLDTVPDVYRIAILSSELIFWILYRIDLSTWRCSIGFMKWVAFAEV